MRILLKIVKWLAALVVVVVIGTGLWLYAAPPALIRIAAGYSAKIVCSNVFLAKREPDKVLAVDVQAPGNPVLKYLSVDVDRNQGTVRAGLFGLFGKGLAVFRHGTGCAAVPDGDIKRALQYTAKPPPGKEKTSDALWPEGEHVDASQDPRVTGILDDAEMTGPGMRAVVVVKDGHIVGERYGEGFDAATPLLGWSMTKTVNAAIIGTLVKDGKLTLDQKGLFKAWQRDERRDITLADLMAMSSGLAFNEDYGDVADVTRMLYLKPDMAAFAASMPLEAPIGKKFHYSSGTGVMLSRIWQNAVGDEQKALNYPREALFGPVGMKSALLEADESGTFTGSSYLYATAHDWARFGQLLLQEGEWNGQSVLSRDFVAMMHEPAAASNGVYGKGQLWLAGPGSKAGEDREAGIPEGTYWLEGHDGQSIAIVPSRRLVVVRMGLTPSKLGYHPQPMVAALAKVLD